jgi:hypothetical protein
MAWESPQSMERLQQAGDAPLLPFSHLNFNFFKKTYLFDNSKNNCGKFPTQTKK